MEHSYKLRSKRYPGLRPLPENFAEQVLDLEMEVDMNPSIEALKKVLEIYSMAVEHFEAKNDPKFKYYNERMITTLKKHDNLLTQSSKSRGRSVPSNKNLKMKRLADFALKSYEHKNLSIARQLHQNLEAQNTSLRYKLHVRKSSHLARSVSPVGGEKILEEPLDREIVEIVRKSIEREIEEEQESKLESALETLILEKLMRTSNIKKHYEEQTTPGNHEEMQAKMQAEISKVEEEFEERRRDEINKLKSVN